MTTQETHGFQAEVARLLELMVHSVYSKKDVFLRELISNAADACEKLRFEALSKPELGVDGFEVQLRVDADARILTLADNGIGMSRDELVTNLGTIAKSGTKAFLDQLQDAKDGAQLIGQFGVGFYSVFMVADSVRVTSRRAGSDEAWCWVSDGKGSFTIEDVALDDAPAHGTAIAIALKADEGAFLEATTLTSIVNAYSAHVPVPITLHGVEEEAQTLTEGGALWVKSKSEITEEAYTEFYHHVGMAYDDPAITTHYRAEGRHEYHVLLFVPTQKPFDLFDPERRGKVKLYVRRVFITDDAPIMPAYLRFVRGVVDSEDLPLNLSREMLQDNPVLSAISMGVTNRILSELEKKAKKDAEAYLQIWDAFGPVLKEGLYEDPSRRDQLLSLARFKTSASPEAWRSLADYIADMKEKQDAIYVITAESVEKAMASPQLEGFKARGLEVLLLTDPVDAFWISNTLGHEGKSFKSITEGGIDLSEIALDDDAAGEDAASEGALTNLATVIKTALGDTVMDVKASDRLAGSAVCLVRASGAPDKQLEKLLAQSQGQAMPAMAPILELNPRHALIKALSDKAVDSAAQLDDAAWLLYEQAQVLDGDIPADPAAFAERLGRLMQKAFA